MDASVTSLPILTDLLSGRLDVVLASELTPAERHAYDQFVATAPSGHYRQTRKWAAVAAAGRPLEPLYFLARRGREVVGAGLVLRHHLGGMPLPVAQVEQGPVTASPEDLPEVLAALRQICLGRGILRLSLCPYWSDPQRPVVEKYLSEAGFAPRCGRLSRTRRLDLHRLDDKKTWSANHLIKVRQEIGRAARAGVLVRAGRRDDLPALAGLDPAWAADAAEYFFEANAAFYVATYDGDLISAVFAIIHNGLANVVATLASPRPLPFSKTVLPLTEAVQWARRMHAWGFDMDQREEQEPTEATTEFAYSYCRTEALLVREHIRWF